MPILHSNLETDLRMAAVLDNTLLTTLVDTAAILRLPGWVTYYGAVNGTKSDTGSIRFASLGGADIMTATAAEDSNVAETALTDTSVPIAVVRHALKREIGDLATWTGSAGDISPERLAFDMVASFNRGFNADHATALATATTNVGTSTVDMSADDFFDAMYTLEILAVEGPFFAELHPRQLADFTESLRAEGGALQFDPATREMMAIGGPGLRGRFLGVDIASFTQVVAAGGNREGGMWGAGAFGYKNAIPQPRFNAGTDIVVRMDELLVEIQRQPGEGLTDVIGGAYYGISVVEQARLVGIVTDQ